MLKAEEMMALFNLSIEDYHVKDDVDSPEVNPFPIGSMQELLYTKNWIDTVQWHLEDIIRDPNIQPEKALEIKRRIDASNQKRTDLVEQIDDAMLSLFEGVKLQSYARLNTESPAWAIDRLSILALKLFHMHIEASRENSSPELQAKNQLKLAVLKEQEQDLTTAIDHLLEDLAMGRRISKVYRQMKMYNDPELNPVLYKSEE
ncbi:MAG: hypothetical protein DA405_06185 [Bacteroidetes bacterium]|nr:MAG: hypothetical protein DA405_06185 [Bacteroidota bacterium]